MPGYPQGMTPIRELSAQPCLARRILRRVDDPIGAGAVQADGQPVPAGFSVIDSHHRAKLAVAKGALVPGRHDPVADGQSEPARFGLDLGHVGPEPAGLAQGRASRLVQPGHVVFVQHGFCKIVAPGYRPGGRSVVRRAKPDARRTARQGDETQQYSQAASSRYYLNANEGACNHGHAC